MTASKRLLGAPRPRRSVGGYDLPSPPADRAVLRGVDGVRSCRMRIFISHSSKDSWVAQRLATEMEALGVDTFIDENDIETGDVWDARLRDELVRSDEIVLLLSSHAAASDWVLIEIGAAWALEKRVVPILHGTGINELPAVIEKRHARDLNNVETYYDELRERLSDPEHETEPVAPIVTPAPEGALRSRPIRRTEDLIVGDIVRISEELDSTQSSRRDEGRVIDFAPGMERYRGRVSAVAGVDLTDESARLQIDGGRYWWAYEWLEIVSPHTITFEDVPAGTKVIHPALGHGVVVERADMNEHGETPLSVEFDGADEVVTLTLEATPLQLADSGEDAEPSGG